MKFADLGLGDQVRLRKPHPCGGFEWSVYRLGADIGLQCRQLPPQHRSGLVDGQPGLYFVGLHFLHALSSGMVHGVGRDAARIVEAIKLRASLQPKQQRVWSAA